MDNPEGGSMPDLHAKLQARRDADMACVAKVATARIQCACVDRTGAPSAARLRKRIFIRRVSDQCD